ncbi:MAG: transposase [Armatimonadetes bacterium]|nr:transposase [Armatimonadota bacterium]
MRKQHPAVVRELGQRVDWNEPRHAHELTLSCFKRLPLIQHDEVRRTMLDVLDEVRSEFDLQVWAYVLMPEHLHLLLKPNQESYSIERIRSSFRQKSAFRALSWLRQNDTSMLHELRIVEKARVGARFWQEGKGYDRNLWSSNSTYACIAYIHGNPVARGLCERPDEWPWSSYRFYECLPPWPFEVDRCPVETI